VKPSRAKIRWKKLSKRFVPSAHKDLKNNSVIKAGETGGSANCMKNAHNESSYISGSDSPKYNNKKDLVDENQD